MIVSLRLTQYQDKRFTVEMRRASTYARKGWKQALRDNTHLKEGLNVAQGKLTYAAVGEALGMGYISADEALV